MWMGDHMWWQAPSKDFVPAFATFLDRFLIVLAKKNHKQLEKSLQRSQPIEQTAWNTYKCVKYISQFKNWVKKRVAKNEP